MITTPACNKALSKQPQTPHPNIITQVKKEDEKKSHFFDFMSLYRCCSVIWKCLPFKSKENFNHTDESIPALLKPQLPRFSGKKILVLDLDETLVHSTFDPITNADIVLPVQIQGVTYKINVILRPGIEEFLAKVGEMFEVVIFTASLTEYAEPLVRLLDVTNSIASLLYRQHCTLFNGVYVKDLSLLGRDIKDIILVDNSPNSFLFQPENAYHIKNFFDDKSDRELFRLAAFLENITKASVSDVRPIEDLRRTYEPTHSFSNVKVVTGQISGETEVPETIPATQGSKKKEEKERAYNHETEPDLRNNQQPGQQDFCPRQVPFTERIVVNDRFAVQPLDSSDIELPASPKESDALINHREAKAYFENNSNETESKDGKKEKKDTSIACAKFKSKAPVLNSINNHEANVVAVEESEIEGHKVEEVRYDTGIDNLNSPLGRHVKIEYKKNAAKAEEV